MPVSAHNITHTTSASGKGMTKIQQLDLDQAETGMVLGEHALGRQGQLLLRAGTVLNDRHLQMLRANAVAQVAVGTGAEPVGSAAPVDGDSEETARRALSPLRRAGPIDSRIAAHMPPTCQGTTGARR